VDKESFIYVVPSFWKRGNVMPRRKASDSIVNVLSIAERIRNQISGLPIEIRDRTKDLALAIVTRVPGKRRRRLGGRTGRPQVKPRGLPRGRPKGRPKRRRRGRPRGRPPGRPKAPPQVQP
jgi:hypothetical protein